MFPTEILGTAKITGLGKQIRELRNKIFSYVYARSNEMRNAWRIDVADIRILRYGDWADVGIVYGDICETGVLSASPNGRFASYMSKLDTREMGRFWPLFRRLRPSNSNFLR